MDTFSAVKFFQNEAKEQSLVTFFHISLRPKLREDARMSVGVILEH